MSVKRKVTVPAGASTGAILPHATVKPPRIHPITHPESP
jgi:hypothetical protein